MGGTSGSFGGNSEVIRRLQRWRRTSWAALAGKRWRKGYLAASARQRRNPQALQRGQAAIRQLQRDQSGIIPGGAKNHPRAAGAVAQTGNARVITRLPPNPFLCINLKKKQPGLSQRKLSALFSCINPIQEPKECKTYFWAIKKAMGQI